MPDVKERNETYGKGGKDSNISLPEKTSESFRAGENSFFWDAI